MKLEVGMYVRYKYEEIVFIGKITFISEVMCGLDETLQIDIDNCMEEILKKDIIKASHNIIDLIEENDYIRIVTSAFYEPVYYSYGKLVIRDDIDISKYTNKFIAEVITHEQMKSISYRIEDEE